MGPRRRTACRPRATATTPGCSTWSRRWPSGTGRMAVVLPQGALFRKGAEGRIRQALLEQDLVEAVIGLAPNLFYGTGLAPASWSSAARSRPSARSKVLVVDASSLFRKGRAQNFLEPEHAEQIVALGAAPSRTSRTAPRSSASTRSRREDWTLNISRYVLPPIGEDIPPLPEAVAAFKQALAECRAAEDRLRELIEEADGWLVSKAAST